jgi:hypothetical protein
MTISIAFSPIAQNPSIFMTGEMLVSLVHWPNSSLSSFLGSITIQRIYKKVPNYVRVFTFLFTCESGDKNTKPEVSAAA